MFKQQIEIDEETISKINDANLYTLEKVWFDLKSFNQKQSKVGTLIIKKRKNYFSNSQVLFCHNPNLRRLIYTILNMLELKQFMYMIVQSLMNDLSSNNQYIRQTYLKYISLLDDEGQIMKVEKIIRNALLGNNLLLQSQAMLVGLKILNKFPNLVRNQYSQIMTKDLSQNQFQNQLQKLNLLYELKQEDTHTLLKIIIQYKNQKLTTIVKQQLIKYIKEILLLNDDKVRVYSQELKQYLLSQLYYSDSIVFFEAAIAVISILSITNQQLQPMMKFLMNYVDSLSTNIESYSTLQIFELLIKNQERKNLVQQYHLKYIESLTFSEHISVSSQALNLCIYLEKKYLKLSEYLQTIYQSNEDQQLNFLQGMLGLAPDFQRCGIEMIKFLQLILPQSCTYEIADLAFLITEQIYLYQPFNFLPIVENLFLIAHSFSPEHKMRAILLFQERCFIASFDPISPQLSSVEKDFKRLVKQLNLKDKLEKSNLKILAKTHVEKI